MNQNSWLSAVTTCIYLSDGLIPFADGLTALSRSSGITTCIANNTFQVEDFNFSLYTMELFFSPQFFETLCIHILHRHNTITSPWRHCLTNWYDFLSIVSKGLSESNGICFKLFPTPTAQAQYCHHTLDFRTIFYNYQSHVGHAKSSFLCIIPL